MSEIREALPPPTSETEFPPLFLEKSFCQETISVTNSLLIFRQMLSSLVSDLSHCAVFR